MNSILNGYSNKEDIEECISDVFISVYNDIHTYDNKKGKFETFVFIKAKYIALDYKRKIIKKKEYEKIKEDRLLKINENIAYESAEKEVIKKEKLKDIEVLPESLQEALDIAKESEFIKSVIGSEFLNRYVELKQTEVDRYNKAIEKENIKRMYFEYI